LCSGRLRRNQRKAPCVLSSKEGESQPVTCEKGGGEASRWMLKKKKPAPLKKNLVPHSPEGGRLREQGKTLAARVKKLPIEGRRGTTMPQRLSRAGGSRGWGSLRSGEIWKRKRRSKKKKKLASQGGGEKGEMEA